MKIIRFLTVFCVLVLATFALPVMAVDETTCTSVPGGASGLPECSTRHDNECYPGGALYREDNQDGCPTEWYWKAGWYLSRVNDGVISRSDVPDEFASVLPPETEEPKIEEPVRSCTVTYSPSTGMAEFEAHWDPQPGQDVWGFWFTGTEMSLNEPLLPVDRSSVRYSYNLGTGYSFTEVEFVLQGYMATSIIITFPCAYHEI
jgi:hypothetical protein